MYFIWIESNWINECGYIKLESEFYERSRIFNYAGKSNLGNSAGIKSLFKLHWIKASYVNCFEEYNAYENYGINAIDNEMCDKVNIFNELPRAADNKGSIATGLGCGAFGNGAPYIDKELKWNLLTID